MTSTEAAVGQLGHHRTLDGMRGVAVVLVLAGHLTDGEIVHAGSTGVNLFFVLSGFLITALLLDEHRLGGHVRLGNFFARRALRLAPAMAVLLLAAGTYAALTRDISAPVLYPALYVANVAMAAGRDLGAIDHTWSLSLEEQFYLVWPLLLLLTLRGGTHRPLLVALAGIGLSWAATVVVFVRYDPLDALARASFGPDTRSYALFLGCALALVLPYVRPYQAVVRRLAWPAVAVILLVATLPLSSNGPYFVLALPLATVAGTALLVHLLEPDDRLGTLLGRPPIVYLGRISYGLYLWHLPIHEALQAAAPEVSLGIRAPVVAALTLAVAATSFRFLEQPLLARKRRFPPAGR